MLPRPVMRSFMMRAASTRWGSPPVASGTATPRPTAVQTNALGGSANYAQIYDKGGWVRGSLRVDNSSSRGWVDNGSRWTDCIEGRALRTQRGGAVRAGAWAGGAR